MFKSSDFKVCVRNPSIALADMSDFIESEAEESEEEFEEKDLKPKKTQRFMEDDDDGKRPVALGMMVQPAQGCLHVKCTA